MKSVRHPGLLLILPGLLASCLMLSAQKLPWQTSATASAATQQPVRFLYPQQVAAQPGKPDVIELHFRVADGLHINSHTPTQKSLIRTELIAAEPDGVKITAVDFPSGSPYAFPAAPAEKLSIYSGEFVVRMHIVAQRGDHLIQGALRYQACDNSTCFPPRNAPVAVDVIAR